MTNLENALRASHNRSLETVRSDAHGDVPLSAREAAIRRSHAPTPVRIATAVHNDIPVKFESHYFENCRTNHEYVIAREVKSVSHPSAVKEMVMDELLTLFKNSVVDILGASFHNARSEIQSVVYNFGEPVMLDLLRKEEIGKALDSHIVNFLTLMKPRKSYRRVC